MTYQFNTNMANATYTNGQMEQSNTLHLVAPIHFDTVVRHFYVVYQVAQKHLHKSRSSKERLQERQCCSLMALERARE
jgi:hypothetical protein